MPDDTKRVEFVIRRDAVGRFRWEALGERGECLVRSAPLATHGECVRAILVLKVEASSAPTLDLTAERRRRVA